MFAIASIYNKLTDRYSDFLKRKKEEEKRNGTKEVFLRLLEEQDVFLKDKNTAHVMVSDHDVLSMNGIPGLHVETHKIGEGEGSAVSFKIAIDDHTKPIHPIHMCFGKLSSSNQELQRIIIDFNIGSDCKVEILAHCMFHRRIVHLMEGLKTLSFLNILGSIKVGEGSQLKYNEVHIHPEEEDCVVKPCIKVHLSPLATFISDFEVQKGKCGELDLYYDIVGEKESTTDVTARVNAKKNDKVFVTENAKLIGKSARALLKTRVGARNKAQCTVKNILIGCEENTKGHVDCQELVQDEAKVSAIPQIRAEHPLSQITHEASLGRVNEKQLETLLSKGLGEDEATDFIINGALLGESHPILF